MKTPIAVPFHRALCPLLVIPIALAMGCQDPDFNTPELLRAPRVLAVQAEPPQPSYGASTTLRALIYQPLAKTDAAECAGVDAEPKYQWSWCPLPTSSANGYECSMKQADLDQLAAMLGLGQAPQLDLGTAETATLVNPFPAALLFGLCTDQFQLPFTSPSAGNDAAASLFKLPCEYSVGDDRFGDNRTLKHPLAFPITVMLKYTPPCGSPAQDNFGSQLTTIFTVRLPTDESVPPDQNPTVGEIFALPDFTPDAGVLGNDSAAPAPLDAGTSDDGGGAQGQGQGQGQGIDGGEALDGGQPDLMVETVTPPPESVRLDLAKLPRQKRVGLWVSVPTSAAEALPRPSTSDEISKGNVQYFEGLTTVWFSEAGEFGGKHGSYQRRGGYLSPPNEKARPAPADEEQQFEDHVRRTYLALPTESDYPHPTAKVVVVVRDYRGGVAWASGVATINPPETRP